MRWGDYIKRTAVRRVVWIVVGLLVYAALSWFGVARAQSSTYPTGAEAYAACMSHAQGIVDGNPGMRRMHENTCARTSSGFSCHLERRYTPGGSWSRNLGCGFFNYEELCPADSGEWRDDLKRCFDPSECFARNQEEGYGVPTTKGFQSECIAGCTLATSGPWTSTEAGGITAYHGAYEYTGDQCTMDPTKPPVTEEEAKENPPQTCIPVAGQNICIKSNGDHCYTASSGKQICWKPTETGEKYAGDTLQKRNAGPDALPIANPNLPSGDVLEPSGEPVTVTTTRHEGGSTTTTTTTTHNHKTVHGTAPGPDQGEPDDGSGGPEGEGDSDEGTADGGGDCDTPPIVSGDAILGMVADQAWATRCAVEAGNAAKVEGDVGDCSQPFTVEGDNANAEQLRAMRANICAGYEGNVGASEDGQADADGYEALLDDAEETGIWGDGDGEGGGGQGINPNWLSFGGGSCPVISFEIPNVGTFEPPPMFCDVIAALALLFQLLAMVWALQIVGS